MEPRLHNAQEISRRSQLHNAHIGVDVGRVAANKNEYCNPNHLNISYFENPKPFFTLWSHIYAIDYLDSCFDQMITLFSYLNRLTMRAKVKCVYNILNDVRNFA